MEQASSHQVAQFRALEIEKVLGQDFTSADMTGGMGIDTLLLSDYGRRSVTYIERNRELCLLAERNFSRVCGDDCRITVVNADSVEHLSNAEHFDFIYADPARRSTTGRKLVSISDCEPDLLPHIDSLLCKCTLMGVKLSPMLDISVALKELRHVQKLYVIGLGGECKELFALLSRDCNTNAENVPIHCISLPLEGVQPFSFTISDEQNATVRFSMPQRYLYEPSAVIMKAGAFKSVCARYGLSKLHPSSHLYTSETLVEGFPGRTFEITDIRKVHKPQFKDIDKANLTVRNFPTSVAEIRKNIGVKEGGDVYLFATTLMENSKRIIVCKRTFNFIHTSCSSTRQLSIFN